MKVIRLYCIRAYLKLGFFFYFRSIYIHNVNVVSKDKPVLFLANHQNALLDALLIATSNKRFLYFLTRASVFKSLLADKILRSLQMLPVYRKRDGWSNLSNNTEIFNTCAELFNNNEAVVIFPEGSHNINRTVRSLSKGFTRIIFETFERYPNTDLQLIPVGLNFINAGKFPDSAAIFFGEAIPAKSFITGHKNEDIVGLRTKIQSEISKLTTHIPSEDYETILNKLNDLDVDFLNPKEVNKTISSNFQTLVCSKKKRILNLKSFFRAVLKLLLIVPYIIWEFMVKPKVKEVEFLSTFRFALAITLVPIWLLFMLLLLGLTLSWGVAFGYLFTVVCVALIAVKL